MVAGKKRTLLIISHTPHYAAHGQVFGWGPTVSEINQLTSLFSTIRHIAPLHSGPVPPAALACAAGVELKAIAPFGGDSLAAKGSVWRAFRQIVSRLNDTLPLVDVVHLRLPMGAAVFLLPWLRLFYHRKIWFKYAGNLDQAEAPLGYRLQRFWLDTLFKNSPVACNGSQHKLPANYRLFENPCLTASDLTAGQRALAEKDFTGQLRLLFAGHIAPNKGVYRIVELLRHLPPPVRQQIRGITFAGEGEVEKLQMACREAGLQGLEVKITGGLGRTELFRHYRKAHILLLLSDSEGFPKVVAEAAAFGCVPAVSDVSALSRYLNPANGLLFTSLTPGVVVREFSALIADREALAAKALRVTELPPLFTYERYLQRLQAEILPALK